MKSSHSVRDHVPLREFVVKITSRCNLACDYCYEYALGDISWRSMPKVMSTAVALAAAQRIREHAADHGLKDVHISFHGGEPLLVGAEHLRRLARIARSLEDSGLRVSLNTQTNATLIDDAILEVLRELDIAVGVSIDGPRKTNDRHRLDHTAASSFDATMRGIKRLRDEAPEQFGGLLSVIDVNSDPLEVFDFIAALGIDYVDFLLPHHHWDRPPQRNAGHPPVYGRWLATIWDAWVSERHPTLRIRFFENLVRRLVGAPGIYEDMNPAPVTLVTIATNGDIEAVDTMKSASPGCQTLGFNVVSHRLDEVLAHPHMVDRRAGLDQLAPGCLNCEHVAVCAGGYYPHRFGRGRGFANPSVYCDDLFWLVEYINNDVRRRSRASA